MQKEKIIALTKDLYRLTLLFPKKEPLRYKMRELADEILAKNQKIKTLENSGNKKLQEEIYSLILEDLDILSCFFEIVKDQRWVKTSELYNVDKEYEKLTEELKIKKNKIKLEKTKNNEQLTLTKALLAEPTAQTGQTAKKDSNEQVFLPDTLSGRQEKILAFLREQGKAQVWQVKQIFPQVTKRTLRRDFERLLRRGMIERVGERNNTFYQFKTS